MEQIYVERAIQLLSQVVAMQTTMQGCIKEATAILRAELLRGNNSQSNARLAPTFPYIDPATFSVRWNGSTCILGATIPLRLLERLCRRPNCFISYENLLQDVWQGARKSQSTVRSTVCRLKRSLKAGGMTGLAQSIRCQSGHFALLLEDLD